MAGDISNLLELNDGDALTDLADDLRELVKAVQAMQVKGEVTLKISVEPVAKAPHMIATKAAVSAKLPKRGARVGMHFVTGDGELTQHNPAQKRMDFTVVNEATGESVQVREMPAARRMVD